MKENFEWKPIEGDIVTKWANDINPRAVLDIYKQR